MGFPREEFWSGLPFSPPRDLPYILWLILIYYYTAAAAKLLQSCSTLCDPRDGSPPGSPVPGIPQARTLEWVAISFSNKSHGQRSLEGYSPGVKRLGHDWATEHTHGAHSCTWSSQTPVVSMGFIPCFLCPHPLLPGKRCLTDKCTDQWLQSFPKQPWPLVSTLPRLVSIPLVPQNEIREKHQTVVLLTVCCRGCSSELCVSLSSLAGCPPGEGRPLMLWEETKYSCFSLVEKWHTPNLILKPACDHKEI